jgi:DNA-binding NtrC family response regulator
MTELKRNLTMRILIVDDDKNICKALGLSLSTTKCLVATVNSVEEAIATLQQENFDLILSDFKMHGRSGLDLLKQAKIIQPEALVVIMTAYTSIENVISVMREGAYDYLPKPFTNDQFLHFLNRIQGLVNLKSENAFLKKPLVKDGFFAGLTSSASASLSEFVKKMAPSEATILLTGESGTGKSEVANLIHALSPRSKKPFVTVYCSTLTESLQESELFGHIQGAVPGSPTEKLGQIQVAVGGTLFLDEVDSLTAGGQAKLLRFLQDKVFQKVGSIEEVTADTRIIAATNKDLLDSVEQGKFREDLYYRLNTFEFTLVALRHRKEDVPIYTDRFLKERQVAEKLSDTPIIPNSVLEKMSFYNWPGNLRELKNTIQRLVILSLGRPISIDDLPPAFRQEARPLPGTNLNKSLEEIEKDHILAVLQKETNFERAAELLGITKATLWRKRKQYGLI